jgi:hypothetical protein
MRISVLTATVFALFANVCPAIEVSTGFLIGPRHDPRAFYFRDQPGGVWRKSYSDQGFRKQAQGRLVGAEVVRGFAAVGELAREGLMYARLALQSAEVNLFEADGSLRKAETALLLKALHEANDRGMAVELVLFHPDQDQHFEAPEAFDNAVAQLTDWLIDTNQRHVMLNPGGDWSAAGWDFENYVPQHLARFAQIIRDRFQERHTDYALPVAISAEMRLTAASPVVQEADVLVLRGEALATDPRSIERPLLVVAPTASACAAALQRFSGCLLESGIGGEGLSAVLRTR